MPLNQADKLAMLSQMLIIRQFEESAYSLVDRGEIIGEVHQYTGQEAVAVGVCQALKKEDIITSTHRGHGHILAKGGDVDKMMAEIGGRTTGYCKGKGGSMHITSIDLGIYGANGMVGQGIPIALGAAFAIKYEKRNNVVVSFFGDGAANEGALHESMNMAAIWNLPIIFACENNQYAVTTSVKASTSVENIADRAQGYGMPGIVVDGMNVLSAYDAAKEAVDRARSGGGPTFLEFKTYRYYGHFSSEPKLFKDPYRSTEELNHYLKKDPIEQLKSHLMQLGCTASDFEAMDRDAKETVEHSVTYMLESPLPVPEDAFEDAYAVLHESMPVRGWS